MRLSQKLSRLAATLLATTLLACTAALPASAELDKGVSRGSTVTVNTVFTIPANVKTPNVTFTYTVDDATATNEKDGDNDVKSGVENGVYVNKVEENKVLSGNVTFAPTDSIDTGEGKGTFDQIHTVTKSIQLTVDPSVFPSAGVYKYTITQSLKTPNDNVTPDDNTVKTLYVYVTEDTNGTRSIAYTKLFAGNNQSGKTDNFSASYLKNYVPGDGDGTLLLSKIVTGDFGDKDKGFSFTVTIDPATEGNTYYYEVGTVDKDGAYTAKDAADQNFNTQVIDASGKTITLKHYEAIKIYGLVAGDDYAIVENDGGKNGYSTTATIGGQNASFPAIEDPENPETTVVQYSVAGTIAQDNESKKVEQVKVAYTNDRTSTTPTGVVMNVAPYILLVVIAVAGAFVFLRKRRED